jgi:hypothetical protein
LRSRGETIVVIRKPKPDSLPVLEQRDYFHPALVELNPSIGEMEKPYREAFERAQAEMPVNFPEPPSQPPHPRLHLLGLGLMVQRPPSSKALTTQQLPARGRGQ